MLFLIFQDAVIMKDKMVSGINVKFGRNENAEEIEKTGY
jgi:hypothetical protein